MNGLICLWLHRYQSQKLQSAFFPLFLNICIQLAAQVLVVAGRIQFPDQRSNPDPLHWELRVLATGPPAKPLQMDLDAFIFIRYSVGLSIPYTQVLHLQENFLYYLFVNSFFHPLLETNFFSPKTTISQLLKPLNKSFIFLIFFSYFLPLFLQSYVLGDFIAFIF